MDGSRLLVDTNIVLYALQGDMALAGLLDGQDLFISFITRIELLSYPKIDQSSIDLIERFLEQIPVVESNPVKTRTPSCFDVPPGWRYPTPSSRRAHVSLAFA